jgi:deoxyribodipyrimidine photolyase-related protein
MILFLIFSTQLFDWQYLKNVAKKIDIFFIIEDPVYFTSHKFHKLKLAYHRASMKYYYDYLKSNKLSVKYFEFKDNYLSKLKNHEIFCYNPVDNTIIKKLKEGSKKYNFKLTILETPAFITTHEDLESYHKMHLGKKFMHDTSFYKWQKSRLIGYKKIIKTKTYDKENRNPFPNNQKDVFIPQLCNNKYINEAKKYVNKYFKNNWGSLDHFIYPITHSGAKIWLNNFIKNRINKFGKYQDAFQSNVHFGYHSVLSPMLNIGLLTDKDILDVLYKSKSINSSSLEGYIRQIIGWKQSMRYLYEFHFNKFYRKNYLNHKNKISNRFLNGTTGIPIVDSCIQKTYDYSYLHHIERLMVIGQFFLITMVDPKDVYEWFISAVSIDSYEWVMIPNIYGMIMYADGGFMMSRPYFSSSNYIKKMNRNEALSTVGVKLSDGVEYGWDKIWDALYYNLINTHKNIFIKNYFIARNVRHWNKKTTKEKKELLNLAKLYFKYLNTFI